MTFLIWIHQCDCELQSQVSLIDTEKLLEASIFANLGEPSLTSTTSRLILASVILPGTQLTCKRQDQGLGSIPGRASASWRSQAYDGRRRGGVGAVSVIQEAHARVLLRDGVPEATELLEAPDVNDVELEDDEQEKPEDQLVFQDADSGCEGRPPVTWKDLASDPEEDTEE